jgi:hypothetical protein
MTKFKAGQSGNPRGRPRGKRNSSAEMRDAIAMRIPDVIERVIAAALDGDAAAAKLLLDRSLPPLRPRDEAVALPVPADTHLSTRGEAVVQALMAGQLGADIANATLSALAHQARLVESTELEQRVSELEKERASASQN